MPVHEHGHRVKDPTTGDLNRPIILKQGTLLRNDEAMDESVLLHVLHCSQCGGEIHPNEGQIFYACPHCTTSVYLEKSQVVFHWMLTPTIDEVEARTGLAQWMAGDQTVKDLDQKSTIVDLSFQYFPIWSFKYRRADGEKLMHQEPAAETSVSEIKRLQLPAGDLVKFNPSLEAKVVQPTIPLNTALLWMQAKTEIQVEKIIEKALVHVPLFVARYTYDGKPYTALVEAVSGSTLANIYPEKAEVPYQRIGTLTVIIFIILSLIPVIGMFLSRGEGFITSLLIYLALAILAGLVLILFAMRVAAKI